MNDNLCHLGQRQVVKKDLLRNCVNRDLWNCVFCVLWFVGLCVSWLWSVYDLIKLKQAIWVVFLSFNDPECFVIWSNIEGFIRIDSNQLHTVTPYPMNFVRVGRAFLFASYKCPRVSLFFFYSFWVAYKLVTYISCARMVYFARHGLRIGPDGSGLGYLRKRDLISVEPSSRVCNLFPKFFSCEANQTKG